MIDVDTSVATEVAPLTEDDRAELSSRAVLIDFYRRTTLLLESERNLFMSSLLTSRGLDPAKRFLVADDGSLTEVADG